MLDVTPLITPNVLHIRKTNFEYEGSYLPGVICNIVVKADFGRSPQNGSWDIYYGIYLAAILDSSRKGGNFCLFLNNYVSKQSVSIYSHVRCNPLNTLNTPLHDKYKFQL